MEKKVTKLTKRESKKIDCRVRILKTSRRLFTANGYDETTMDDIAEKAGVSKATVYNYFPNKESLLIGTVNEVMDQEAEFINNDEYSNLNSEQKIRNMMEFFVGCIWKYPSLSRRIAYLNSCKESTLYRKGDRMLTILTTLVDNAIAEGVFRKDTDTETVVDILIGIGYMVLFQWDDIDAMDEAHLHRRLDEYISILLGGLNAVSVN